MLTVFNGLPPAKGHEKGLEWLLGLWVKSGANATHCNRTRIEFTPINREYISKQKDELNLGLSKVVNMLITESRNR